MTTSKATKLVLFLVIVTTSWMITAFEIPGVLISSAQMFPTTAEWLNTDGENNGKTVTVILIDVGGYPWLLKVDGGGITGWFYDHDLEVWPVHGTIAGMDVYLVAENRNAQNLPDPITSIEFTGAVERVGTTSVLVGVLRENRLSGQNSNAWRASIYAPAVPFF